MPVRDFDRYWYHKPGYGTLLNTDNVSFAVRKTGDWNTNIAANECYSDLDNVHEAFDNNALVGEVLLLSDECNDSTVFGSAITLGLPYEVITVDDDDVEVYARMPGSQIWVNCSSIFRISGRAQANGGYPLLVWGAMIECSAMEASGLSNSHTVMNHCRIRTPTSSDSAFTVQQIDAASAEWLFSEARCANLSGNRVAHLRASATMQRIVRCTSIADPETFDNIIKADYFSGGTHAIIECNDFSQGITSGAAFLEMPDETGADHSFIECGFNKIPAASPVTTGAIQRGGSFRDIHIYATDDVDPGQNLFITDRGDIEAITSPFVSAQEPLQDGSGTPIQYTWELVTADVVRPGYPLRFELTKQIYIKDFLAATNIELLIATESGTLTSDDIRLIVDWESAADNMDRPFAVSDSNVIAGTYLPDPMDRAANALTTTSGLWGGTVANQYRLSCALSDVEQTPTNWPRAFIEIHEHQGGNAIYVNTEFDYS